MKANFNKRFIEIPALIKDNQMAIQHTKSETHRMCHVHQIRSLQREQRRMLARLDTAGLVDNKKFLKDLGIGE